jgi:hypothetical protein
MYKKPGTLIIALSNMEELVSFLALFKVRMHKKPGPLTIALSSMEELDAFLAPVKVLS